MGEKRAESAVDALAIRQDGEADGAFEPGNERRRVKLSDKIYDEIFALIVSGKFPQNSKLPTEAQLSERFQASRPIIREALARLRDDGLVFSRQGSGSFVVQRQPDRAVLRFAPVNSIADMQRCFEFRVALESEAAGLAAERRDADALARMQAALKALDAVTARGELGVDADFDFHLTITQASGNRFFADTMASLLPHIRFGMTLARNLSLLRPRARLKTVQNEHVAIYRAIQDGNAEAARREMAAHIENARQRVFEGHP